MRHTRKGAGTGRVLVGWACAMGSAWLAFNPAPARADEGGLDLSGSVRVRYEAYDGAFRSSGATSDDALTIQTRLLARYAGEGFRIGAEVRDSRGYAIDSDTPITSAHLDAMQVPQLYLGVDLGPDVSVTAGRQLLNLGSKRLVGDPGWRNVANAFTGVRLDWKGHGGAEALSVFYTLPDKRRPEDKAEYIHNAYHPDTEGFDLRFWGGLATLKRGAVKAEAYAYFLDERDDRHHATANRHLQTLGGRLNVDKQHGFDMELEAALQLGRTRRSKSASALSVPVRAYMVHAQVGYAVPGPLSARLSLRADIGSGDKSDTARHERFDSLFGPRRDLGPTSLYGPLGYANLRSIGVRAEIAPSKTVDAFVEWRKLALMEAGDAFSFTGIRDAQATAGRDAGSQIQGRVRWWLAPKKVKLDLGAAWLDKGRFLKTAANVQDRHDTHYGYADIYVFF